MFFLKTFNFLKRIHIMNTSIMSNINQIVDNFLSIGYSEIARGSKRIALVSLDKTHIVKIPHDPIGFWENIQENLIYSNNPNANYARCELLENKILKMEYVEVSDPENQ